MIRGALVGLAGTVVACAGLTAQPASRAADVLLVGATLIDGTGAPAVANAWIHVRGDRIAAIGRGAAPRVGGARVVRLEGRTVMPGLADMHAHLGALPTARWMITLLMAHGVTTVLDPANSLGDITAIKRWAATEDALPHLYFANTPIQGSYAEQRFLQPGAEIERLVADYAAFGVDFLKVYNWLSSAGLKQVGELARRHRIPVTGHTPLSWTSIGSIDAGLTMLQHLRLRPYEVIDDLELVARYPVDGDLMRRTGYWAHFDSAGRNAAQTLAAWEKRRAAFFVTPTLVTQESIAESYDYPAPAFETKRGLDLLSPAMRERFKRRSPPLFWGRLNPAEIDEAKRALDGMAAFVGLAHRRGVRVLAGTDTPIPWLVPGESLHRELEIFVRKSGMSPVEAIRTATGHAAAALGVENRGRIAAGQVADLVIVTGDVAADIGAVRNVEHVMLAGRLMPRAELLGRAARWAALDTPE